MPIYGYQCGGCGHEFEVMQSMSDAPLRTCPECGGALRKLLYPVGVQFKGSGFYTTDYRNGSRGSGKGAESDGGSKAAEGSKAAKPSEGAATSTGSSSGKSGGESSGTSTKKAEAAAS